jgi:hypothetical protein
MLLDLFGLIQSRKVGGDDALHSGWNKDAWEKRQLRDNAIQATIEETYKRIMGIAPEPVIVAEIKQEAKQEIGRIDYTQERIFIDWLSKEIASIKTRIQEEDEEDAILLLLGY